MIGAINSNKDFLPKTKAGVKNLYSIKKKKYSDWSATQHASS